MTYLHISPRVARFAGIAIAAVVAASCTNNPPYRDPGAARGSVETAYHQWRNAMSSIDPGAATARGDHRVDAQLEPCNSQLLKRAGEWLHRAKDDLLAIDGVDLVPEAAADRSLLLARIESDLLMLEKIRPFDRDPLWTLQIISRALTSLENSPDMAPGDRTAALTSRVQAIPEYLSHSRKVVTAPSQVHAEIATEMAEALVEYLEKDLSGGSLNLPAASIAAAKEALGEYRVWLTEVVATGPSGFHHSLGRATFDALARAESGLDTNADLIGELAEREFEGAQKRFFSASKEAFPDARTTDDAAKMALEQISNARAIDRDGLVPISNRAAEDARAAISGGAFAKVPAGFAVSVKSAESARHGSALTSGTTYIANGATTAEFAVAAPIPRMGIGDRAVWYGALSPLRLRLAAFEEAAPGRGFARAVRAENSSPIRRDASVAAWDLGWGDYARRNAAEPSNPIERAVMAHEDMLVALRALSAARIHGARMNVAEATELFRRRCLLDGGSAEREAKRCAAEPILALELLGRVEIERIVEELMQKRGFSRGPIHNLILQKGSLPLPVLRSLIL